MIGRASKRRTVRTCDLYLGWFFRSGGFYHHLSLRGDRASLRAGVRRAKRTNAGDRIDVHCGNAGEARLEPHGHSMTLLISFRGVLNCNKATLPPGSHRGIQCVWLLEPTASVLGPYIHIDGVHLTAECVQKPWVSHFFCAFARDL